METLTVGGVAEANMVDHNHEVVYELCLYSRPLLPSVEWGCVSGVSRNGLVCDRHPVLLLFQNTRRQVGVYDLVVVEVIELHGMCSLEGATGHLVRPDDMSLPHNGSLVHRIY